MGPDALFSFVGGEGPEFRFRSTGDGLFVAQAGPLNAEREDDALPWRTGVVCEVVPVLPEDEEEADGAMAGEDWFEGKALFEYGACEAEGPGPG